MNNEEEFKLVKYKNHRQSKPQFKIKTKREVIETESVDEIINRINTTTQHFKESPFYQTLLSALNKALATLNLNGVAEIICYGLGNFSEHLSSKYQLAALLCIKLVYSSKVLIYDPLFTKHEIECLEKLDLHVLKINDEGKRCINNYSTLVFMPHCNSWSELECQTTDALFQLTVPCIYMLKPYVREIHLKNNFHYPNAFSGTSLHIFTQEKLNTVVEHFWKSKPKLVNFNKDSDFITANESDKNAG
ncbi:SRR1-like protein [Copidosoma floridanum]|uniref:SRR1-like protein n=1 Tax=Copidosoma floridanum TaxID=29053 RepID=UPI0006C96C39|nr:SRR1-like protein [Copidosoma floridanum]